jgi:PilZ domain-containing protein
MTYFPQLNPATPAKRLKLSGSVVVAIRSEGDNQPVRAKLHELSATGGLLVLSNALEQGAFVEVAFQTSQGKVRGMAELLSPRRESTSGCLQAFRFVALDDQDHTRLRMAMESLLDRSVVRAPSSKGTSL